MIETSPITPIQDLHPDVKSQKDYWNIAFHSVVTFLGQSLMQVVDLLFCRDLGPAASATVGTATALFAWLMIIGLGLVSSLEYLIPNSIGAKDSKKAHSYFYTGTLVAIVVGFGSTLSLCALVQGVGYLGINPELHDSVKMFSYITAASYIPLFLVPVFRVELQARGHPHDATFAFVFANILNIFLNWVFVYGNLGVPALGLVGSAWANLLSRVGLVAYVWFRVVAVRSKLAIDVSLKSVEYWKFAKEVIRMGGPTSFHYLFEMGAFAFVGILAARLSATQSAAHAIAISLASFIFMIPLGLSSAAALTMSKANGEQNRALAFKLGRKTIVLGMSFAVFTSTVIIFLRDELMRIYTSDSETMKVGISLLWVAAVFQFADAMQAILAGCIRGFGETKVQAKMNAIGHWVVGIPLGIYLGFYTPLQITGLWIGLCTGLFTVAGGLFLGWRRLHAVSSL